MVNQQLISFLTGSNLISEETAVQIVDQFCEMEIEKNNFLLKEGKVCDCYLFLESRFMRSFAHDTEGNEITTGFYGVNEVVFEVSSFFNRTGSKENIQAVIDCMGKFITYDQLNMLFHTLPEFREFGRSILVKGFAGMKNRMLSMITASAEERYVGLINSRPDIFQYGHLKHVASYLGITDTSLSRIRREYMAG